MWGVGWAYDGGGGWEVPHVWPLGEPSQKIRILLSDRDIHATCGDLLLKTILCNQLRSKLINNVLNTLFCLSR
jgi:hypothetical protein